MAEKSSHSGNHAVKSPPKAKALSGALRANLKRRKAAAKGQKKTTSDKAMPSSESDKV